MLLLKASSWMPYNIINQQRLINQRQGIFLRCFMCKQERRHGISVQYAGASCSVQIFEVWNHSVEFHDPGWSQQNDRGALCSIYLKFDVNVKLLHTTTHNHGKQIWLVEAMAHVFWQLQTKSMWLVASLKWLFLCVSQLYGCFGETFNIIMFMCYEETGPYKVVLYQHQLG